MLRPPGPLGSASGHRHLDTGGAQAGSTAAAERSPERFQTLWTEYVALAETIDGEGHPANAAEANDAAGLTPASHLFYADLSGAAGADGGGKWCIESGDDTYVAMTYGGGESVIRMGDDDCTYDVDRATVVGDFMTAEWTRGAELMGDVPASP